MTGNTQNIHSVDYSQWERRTIPRPLHWATLPHKTVLSFNKSKVTPSPTEKSGKSHKQVHNDFTRLPKLPTRRTGEKVEEDQITRMRKDDNEMLKLFVVSRKQAIKDLEEHCEQLQEMNLRMARNIVDTDRSSVSRANDLLIQSQQMKRSMTALKQLDESLIKGAKAELTDTEEASQTHLSGLQKQLDNVKAEVVKARKEVRMLKTYKDMQFPVKALQIADMERKLEQLQKMQKDEQEDMSLLFGKEMVRLERCQQQREQEVLSTIVEKHASRIPPIVKLKASQNYTIKIEINMQKKMIMELKQKNDELMRSIQELQLSRPNIREEIFPDVFLRSDKCTPDMDVHLNIPREDLLPMPVLKALPF